MRVIPELFKDQPTLEQQQPDLQQQPEVTVFEAAFTSATSTGFTQCNHANAEDNNWGCSVQPAVVSTQRYLTAPSTLRQAVTHPDTGHRTISSRMHASTTPCMHATFRNAEDVHLICQPPTPQQVIPTYQSMLPNICMDTLPHADGYTSHICPPPSPTPHRMVLHQYASTLHAQHLHSQSTHQPLSIACSHCVSSHLPPFWAAGIIFRSIIPALHPAL